MFGTYSAEQRIFDELISNTNFQISKNPISKYMSKHKHQVAGVAET